MRKSYKAIQTGVFTRRSYSLYATAKKRGAASFTLGELRSALANILNKRPLCPYCNVLLSASNVSLDHKMPVSRGGRNDLLNIQFVCSGCNKAKGDFTDEEYKALLYSLNVLGVQHRNPNILSRVVSALKISQSFRQGAMRRAKRV